MIVYIDQDPSTLGPDATKDDVETYRTRLEAHLEEHFGRSITVRTHLGGCVAGRKCPDDDEIDEYVRDLAAGDGWIKLMGAPGRGMPVYSIDDANGDEITTGLNEHNVWSAAHEIADRRGESVYVWEPGNDEATEVKASTVACQCGKWSHERCGWVGPKDETVVVEWMPEHLRASHTAARNAGVYPANGAVRSRVSMACADLMIERDGDWCSILK